MLINEDDIRRDPEEKYLALMDKQGIKLTGGEVIDSDCVRIMDGLLAIEGSHETVEMPKDIKTTEEFVRWAKGITQTDTEIKDDCIVRIFSDGSREEVKFKPNGIEEIRSSK